MHSTSTTTTLVTALLLIGSVAAQGTGLPINVPDALLAHNSRRCKHSADDLTGFNTDLAQQAQATANTCDFKHDYGDGGYGQNIFAVTDDPDPSEYDITKAVTAWYNEGSDYPWYGREPDGSPDKYVRFAQVIWKASTQIGCGQSKCPANTGPGSNTTPWVFTVCNYNPPGDVGGEFADNVLRFDNDAMCPAPPE